MFKLEMQDEECKLITCNLTLYIIGQFSRYNIMYFDGAT